MHYATMTALIISNITVLALAMLFANSVLGDGLAYFAGLEARQGSAQTVSALKQKSTIATKYGSFESQIILPSERPTSTVPVQLVVRNTGNVQLTSFEVVAQFVPEDFEYLGATKNPTVAPSFPGAFSVLWNVPNAQLAPGATWSVTTYFRERSDPRHYSTRFAMQTRQVYTARGGQLSNQYKESWYFFDDAVSTVNPPVQSLALTNDLVKSWSEGSNSYYTFRVTVANNGNIGFDRLNFLYDYDIDILEYVDSPFDADIFNKTSWRLPLVNTAHAQVSIDFPDTPGGDTGRCALVEFPDVHPAGCDMAHGDTLEPGGEWSTELIFRRVGQASSYAPSIMDRLLPWLFGAQKAEAISIDFPTNFVTETRATLWSVLDVNNWDLNADISDVATVDLK